MIIVLAILFVVVTSTPTDYNYHSLDPVTLDAEAGTDSGWEMRGIFRSEKIVAQQIISYTLSDYSYCTIQNPSLMLTNVLNIADQEPIIDFAIAQPYIFYITANRLVRMEIDNSKKSASGFVVREISNKGFAYIDAFELSDRNMMVILKTATSKFHYVIVPELVTRTPGLDTIPEDFPEFTLDMKLTVVSDYLFIPGGKKGIYIYKYSKDSKYFEPRHVLHFVSDVRDLLISEPWGIAADYDKGIIIFKANLDKNAYEKVEHFDEFHSVKSIGWVKSGFTKNVLAILDGPNNSTKYVVFTLTMKEYVSLSYKNIKVIDGVAHYGDVGGNYGIILMDNSILMTEVTRKGNEVFGYIDSKNVQHAKLYSWNEFYMWLFYTNNQSIYVERAERNNGLLLCNLKEDHEVEIYGYSQVCSESEHDCYYAINVTLRALRQGYDDSVEKVAYAGIIISVVGVVIILILLVVICVIVRKNNQALATLDSYTRIANTRSGITENTIDLAAQAQNPRIVQNEPKLEFKKA